MKKILLVPIIGLCLFVFAVTVKASEKIKDLSEDSIETIVEMVLDLDEDGLTKSQIIAKVLAEVELDEEDEDDSDDEDDEDGDSINKGKGSVKKLNFGQFKKLLRKGDSSVEIAALQEALNDIATDLGLTFNILIADGKFGPATVSVVKMIQAHQQLTADGVVGPVTLEKLNKLLSEDDDSDDDSDDSNEDEDDSDDDSDDDEDDSDDDSDDDNATKAEAEEAIDDLEDMIADAEDTINDSDADADDVEDAEDKLDDARELLTEAQEELADDDYDAAIDRAESGEDKVEDALDEIGEGEDDEDEEDEDE